MTAHESPTQRGHLLDCLRDDPGSGLRWSATVLDPERDAVIDAFEPDRVLSTASVGKILLLLEVARRIETGALDPATPVFRRDVAPVGDSGIWASLDVDELTVADASRLVGALSDNLATNVLVRLVGLESVADLAARLGLTASGLRDIVRDERGPRHPPRLSDGTSGELARLSAAVHRGEAVDAGTSRRVAEWLSLGVDLSLVASAFGLDPLAHARQDRGLTLWNKTGTDDGVRADVGVVVGVSSAVAYAVLAEWDPAVDVRDEVLAAMRTVGVGIRSHVGVPA